MASHSTLAVRAAAWALPLKHLKALVTICLYVDRHLQERDWSCHTNLKGMQSCSAWLAHKGLAGMTPRPSQQVSDRMRTQIHSAHSRNFRGPRVEGQWSDVFLRINLGQT